MLKISLVLMMALSSLGHAGLTNLSTDDLNNVVGQGGVDLNWTLSLNHVYANDMTKNDIYNKANPSEVYYKLDTDSCVANKSLCRLAISPNNHIDADGNKKWLVFKGIQGTLQIDKFSIDGVTILNSLNEPQTAMQISFYDEKPLKIRNLGFESLAIETGTGAKTDLIKEGYENISVNDKYAAKKMVGGVLVDDLIDVPNFDKGTEKGFMGLNVHGNMHMSGNLKIFSYNCSGAAGSRC